MCLSCALSASRDCWSRRRANASDSLASPYSCSYAADGLSLSLRAALMIGGWGSNLLDRLGMHSWTAPGKYPRRGSFIPFSHYRFNLADLFIVSATAVFVLSVGEVRTHLDPPLGPGPEHGAAGSPAPAGMAVGFRRRCRARRRRRGRAPSATPRRCQLRRPRSSGPCPASADRRTIPTGRTLSLSAQPGYPSAPARGCVGQVVGGRWPTGAATAVVRIGGRSTVPDRCVLAGYALVSAA